MVLLSVKDSLLPDSDETEVVRSTAKSDVLQEQNVQNTPGVPSKFEICVLFPHDCDHPRLANVNMAFFTGKTVKQQ